MMYRCLHCNQSVTGREVRGPFGPHYSRINCAQCGQYLAWGKKPQASYSNDDHTDPDNLSKLLDGVESITHVPNAS